MNKKVIKPIVLAIIFICALVTFSVTTNKVNIDLTANMDEASLPVMYFTYNDAVLNELHGYVQEMDIMSMRDDILPIGEERLMSLEMRTYGETVENLSYQIRSLDGTRLLMEEDNAEFTVNGDMLEYSVTLPSLFEEGVEYNMVLTATVGGEPIYYYTRLMKSTNWYVDECLEFALKFHDYTFRDDAATFIPNYMDPATGDPTTLSYVDLSCTLRQITWARFEGTKLSEPIVSFKEINSSYNVLVLSYVMTNVNENSEVEYYNVEEYYRLRQTPTRMYVLNFERTMNQIFRSENDFFQSSTGIQLGIRNQDVEYKANDAGDYIAFVQEGELWCYDRVNNTMVQVYSFRGPEGVDVRENWSQHDVKVVRVDEAGSIDFLVYGYMNRGPHEGEVGIGVYHFDGIAHTVEEEIFISSDKSYEKLKAELGELMYVNEQKQLYLMVNEDIYQIDLTKYTVELLIETQNGEGYAISKSDRFVAWVEADLLNSSTCIHLTDLKTGIEHEITAGENTYLKPLAFLDEDLIYGIADVENVRVDEVGSWIFPMSMLEIINTEDEKLSVIKTYTPHNGLIGDVEVDSQNVYVELISEQDGRYVAVDSDTIMNRETEVANGVYVKTTVTDVKQTQVAINMKAVSSTSNAKNITSKHVLVEEESRMALAIDSNEASYYVYLKGDVLLATTNVSDAILCANQNYGVVVDKNLRYIYKRARSTSQTALKNIQVNEADTDASSLAKCVSAMLEYEGTGLSVNELINAGRTPYYILNSTLKDAMVLELTECGVDELLYYIDLGNPVLAKVGENDAILLTGYSSTRIYYYNPKNGKTLNVEYEEMEDMLYNGGNYFIVYLK